MPELPEVEITRRGIEPHVSGNVVTGLTVRNPNLRWRVPRDLAAQLVGRRIGRVMRRAKYLLLEAGDGWLIVHLGMSGSLRVLPAGTPFGVHDHVDLEFGAQLLRLRDPRRFGAVLWQKGDAGAHKLLASLGVEPLSGDFDGDTLYRASRGRRVAIKQLLMNAAIVVGVGNIYANEALFRAGIHPLTQSRRLTRERCARLAKAIRDTLAAALEAGGSTLRDFAHADGEPGYFQQQYKVYDRTGEKCRACGTPVRSVRQGQRSTFFCPACQTRA